MSGAAVTVAGLLCLLLGGLAVEVCARCGRGPATAGRTLSAAMRTTYGRAMVLLAWVWLGVHFLAR